MHDSAFGEEVRPLSKFLYDLKLTHGSTSNIYAYTEDRGLLVSPMGTSFGRLDPGRLATFHAKSRLACGK